MNRYLKQLYKSIRNRMTILKNDAGINLVDVVLAMFVTCLGALTVCSLVIVSSSANKRATDEVVAANAARQELEIIRTTDSAFLTNRANAPFVGSVPQMENLAEATGYLSVSDYGGVPGLKLVTVRIDWYTRNLSIKRSLTLTTFTVHNGVGT